MGLRKIALVLSLIMVWGMAVASAAITRNVDSFTGYSAISSHIYDDKEVLTEVNLKKTLSPTVSEYEIRLAGKGHKEIRNFILGNSLVEVKVDDKPTYKLAPDNYSIKPLAGSYGNIVSNVTFGLSVQSADEIKGAKRVALRVTMEDGSRYVYILPDPVLAEWQQVINTEK